MVTRKNSLPYPQSPTASSTQAASTTPATGVLGPAVAQSSQHSQNSFMDSDNPWQDQRQHIESVPGAHEHRREHSLTSIPQVLRPGGSGQATPRSSIDSGESRDWWDDDDGDKSPTKSPVRSAARSPDRGATRDIPESLRPRGPSPAAAPQLPSPTSIKRKPLPSSQPSSQEIPQSPTDFASNNPFRTTSSEAPPPPPTAAPPPIPVGNPWGNAENNVAAKGKSPLREPEFSASITDFSRMTISGNTPDPSAYQRVQTPQERDDPWKEYDAPPAPAAPSSNTDHQPQEEEDPWKQFDRPPAHITLPFSLASPANPKLDYQPPSAPEAQDGDQNMTQSPWATGKSPDASSPAIQPVATSNSVFSFSGQQNETAPPAADKPGTAHSRVSSVQQTEPSLLDDDDIGPSLPVRPTQTGQSQQTEVYAPPPGPPPGRAAPKNNEELPPTKPPRPAIITRQPTEEEQAKAAEQRNETYQIKHFNWFDHSSGRLRRSSMLTQNKNGPCPLLALVNALILGAKHESQAALDDALRSREQVSLGLIIETLMYELVDRSAAGGSELPDVDELNAFLMRLRTGMNANPRFVPAAGPAPNLMDARNSVLHMPQQQRAQIKAGTFEMTGDIKLYGSFSVPLLHGWIPQPGSDAAHAFARSAQTYEDAQAIQFGEEELEYKLTRGGLSPEEQRVWEDITSIKNFFRQNPTQLTSTGLENIQQALSSGSFAILFRNDHFSTIYKHPQSGQLFTLITDAGYADRDEIIWESLVDISGRANEFFSGDFMPVSHQQAPASDNNNNTHLPVNDSFDNAPLSPQQQQEQHDADFAMALQLQEEEEQRSRAEAARRRRSTQGNSQSNGGTTALRPGQSPRGSNTNIPISLTNSRQSQSDLPENRPSVPPRRQQGPPAVNRPTDTNDDDAPPAYEEAAKGPAYVPPVGSPLHPTSGPSGPDYGISPMSSSAQLTATVSNTSNNLSANSAHPPGPNAPYYSAGNGMQTQRPGHGRMPSNSIGGPGRLSAYQDQASSSRRPSYSMPGSYNNALQTPVGESSGRRRRGDCIVM